MDEIISFFPSPEPVAPLITNQPRILVVEDDPVMGRLLQSSLNNNGFYPVLVTEAERALALLRNKSFDLILLDWNLPGMNGGSFLGFLRQFSRVPVIVESGNSSLEFRLKAFDLGADDILAKPYGLGELNSRIKAILRRTQSPDPSQANPGSLYQVGGIVLDFANQTVTKNGVKAPLTAKEMELVRFLLNSPGKPVSKEVVNSVLFPGRKETNVNRGDVFVYRIRQKMGKDFIRSMYGAGYVIDPGPAPSEGSLVAEMGSLSEGGMGRQWEGQSLANSAQANEPAQVRDDVASQISDIPFCI